MKKVFIILLGFLILSGCAKEEYSYRYYGLNRPVKSIRVLTYEAESKFGDIVKGIMIFEGNYTAEFNKVGNIISKTELDFDGNIDRVTKFKYNDQNYLSEVYEYFKDGDLRDKETYHYDGKHVIKISFDFGTKYEYIFKRKGKRILELGWYKEDSLQHKYIYSISNEKVAEYVQYDQNGKQIHQIRETFNELGMIRTCIIDTDTMKVEWNNKNLPIKLINYKENPNYPSSFYQDKGAVYHIDYEYDKKGNWIRKIVYEGEGKKPITVSEREIVY